MAAVRLALALAALLLCGGLALADTSGAGPIDDLERDDSLVQSIAWQLQTGNARYCDHAAPMAGIQLEDAAVYDNPALARSTYGLSGDIYVGALAETGPGAAAGLSVNMTVVDIDGHPLAALAAPSRRNPFTRLSRAQAMLDEAAARTGAVELTIADGRAFRVKAIPACQVAFTVDDERSYANATRDDIRLGRRYIDAAHGDPALIAALMAHEMAHAVLDHQSQIIASNRAMSVVRRTEHEADRLSVWLLANAGYPPEAATDLQRDLIAHLLGPLGIDLTHGGWHDRAQRIAKEIVALRAAPDADWPHRFQREP